MKVNNFVTKTLLCFIVGFATCSVNAAETGRSRAAGTNTARMPTLSVMTMNTIGNPAVLTVNKPVEVDNVVAPAPQPTPPTPTPECVDGGVRNTEYTVSMCMADLRSCVDSGAVEGGLHGLFNDEYFSRVLNGNVRICQNVVDNCMTIRKDCKKIYRTSRSVWSDFKSRILWPEYYNFVLYKTGLTPNQAKKTCIRLGARWDAVKAECLVKVVAYNKNKPISNEWLFGVAGDGKDAEAWLKMGDSFTCNKSLFGFSLLNDTATVAATAIPGGAIVGGVIGGIAAKSKHKKTEGDPCASKEYRRDLGNKIESKHQSKVLKTYMFEHDTTYDESGYGTEEIETPDNFYDMDEATCNLVLDLYDRLELYKDGITTCTGDESLKPIFTALDQNPGLKYSEYTILYDENTGAKMCAYGSLNCQTVANLDEHTVEVFNDKCSFIPLQLGYTVANANSPFCNHSGKCKNVHEIQAEVDKLEKVLESIDVIASDSKSKGNVGKGILVGAGIGAATGGMATGITALIESNNIRCVVGNDLASVSLNKSYTIDSLKDLYVKRGFSLPDTVVPTTVVVDQSSWGVACSEYAGNPEDCANAQVVYKHDNTREIVSASCVVSGSMCLVNEDVAESHLPQKAF